MGQLAIIGGGAAGLAAAVAAARELRVRGATTSVVVYEADERVGRTILATGNGRCNFSNAHVDAALYHNASFVSEALAALARHSDQREYLKPQKLFGPADTDPVHTFFASLGLVWREEGEGRLYPLANKATSVLEVLRAAAASLGVVEACGRRVVQLDVPAKLGERFHLRFADGVVEHASAVVLATGGRMTHTLLPKTLEYADTRPVLGPLRTATKVIKHLNNLRVRCAVKLVGCDGVPKAQETGELLFRDYGVSGIAVFNLSRFAEPGDCLLIDFLPQISEEECLHFLHARRRGLAPADHSLTCESFFRGMLLPAIARAVIQETGLVPEVPLTKRDVSTLTPVLKAFPLEVRGIGDERQCQVRRGGAKVSAFSPHTLEARAVPGLYVVGAALDVDAPCGGYNLHWAWASGMLAGYAAVAHLTSLDATSPTERQ